MLSISEATGKYNREDKMKIYLIAQKLSHSFSPLIHKRLSDYSYELCELEKEELKSFFKKREFDGLNVTVPYKKLAFALCDEVTREAKRLGNDHQLCRSGPERPVVAGCASLRQAQSALRDPPE